MKKITSFIFLLSASLSIRSQITLDHTYPANSDKHVIGTRLHNGGFKNLQLDIPNLKMYIYNANHTLANTITLPTLPGGVSISYIAYVSDNLFDADNLIEYCILGSQNGQGKFYIYKENGTQLMFKDSTRLGEYTGVAVGNMFTNLEPVYFDGLATKLRLTTADNTANAREQIFTLPGTIRCIDCHTSVSTAVAERSMPAQETVFYPNPVNDQLQLKYSLPKDYKTAEIKIYDLQGKCMEVLKVTDTFDHIYLPSDYNNGLYLYSLVVDGKIIKTEKIVLNK